MTTTPKLGAYNYRFGAIAAGIGIVFSLAVYFLGLEGKDNSINRIVIILIPTIATFVAGMSFKKREDILYDLKNFIKIGVGVFLIYTILYNLYLLLFLKSTSSDETDLMKHFFNILPLSLLKNIILGMLVGLVTGLFTKKN